jgi:hypothetical protein
MSGTATSLQLNRSPMCNIKMPKSATNAEENTPIQIHRASV